MALIRVAGENAQFEALVDQCRRFEAKSSQFFDSFDSFIIFTICSDAYILRSGDFRADNDDDNDRWTNWLLYPLRMRASYTTLLFIIELIDSISKDGPDTPMPYL